MKQFFYLSILLVLTNACTDPTAQNSMFSQEIQELDATWESIDSAYQVFLSFNHDDLIGITKKAKLKHTDAKKRYNSDTLVPDFDNILMIYKSHFVKGLKGLPRAKFSIDEEYLFSKTQVENLRHDMIHEVFGKDTLAKYLNNEKYALDNLLRDMKWYNSKAEFAFNSYDSLTSVLDSIVILYGKD